jgi:putative transposase
VHLVFRLPAALGAIAYQNKDRVYGLLLKAAAETLTTVAADPKHLGADIGVTAVLHTWGDNLQLHPHAHCIVPGGGISLDGKRWISGKPGLFRPDLLSRLFRRLFLEYLTAAFDAGELEFFTALAGLNEPRVFAAALAPLRTTKWVVYAKKPLAGPKQVLAYLARYTHRVAITNSRLLDLDETHVSFRLKDYRQSRPEKSRVMRIEIGEFIRRFLLHVLPNGFHRIRYYGLLANGHRADKLAICRSLLDVPCAPMDHRNKEHDNNAGASNHESPPCPCCGGRMTIIEIFDGLLSRPYHVRRLDAL